MIPKGRQKSGWIALAALVLLSAFAAFKWLAWAPFAPLAPGHTPQALAKWWATVLLTQPFSWDRPAGAQVIRLGGDPLIVGPANQADNHRLLAEFPPPAAALAPETPFRERITLLRRFVSGLLPAQSAAPYLPEPVRALEILGADAGVRHARLCSKNAKLFVQYLAALGHQARIVQLEAHVAAEVWNAATGRWEYQDPFFDTDARFEGRLLSAAEIHDLLLAGRTPVMTTEPGVFDTVVVVPRNNLAGDRLPAWGYFHYDNLDYWRPQRLSARSPAIWRRP